MKLNGKIIAIVAALALLLGVGALAEGSITVQGAGVVLADADRVSISMGVREVAPDVMSAQAAVNEKISAVIDAMKEMGVGADAISTSGIGIYPNYDYDSGDGETIVGYSAYNNLLVSLTDVNNAGAYIDAAFAAGANSLDYVDFSVDGNDEASEKALVLAMDSAREKAQVLAEAAGLKLGAILQINEGVNNGYDSGVLFAKNEASADVGSGTGVLASKQTISATVSVTFALEE